MRIQKRLKEPRLRLSPSVVKAVKYKVKQLSRVHNCSQSFIVSTILARELGVVQEYYYTLDKKKYRVTL